MNQEFFLADAFSEIVEKIICESQYGIAEYILLEKVVEKTHIVAKHAKSMIDDQIDIMFKTEKICKTFCFQWTATRPTFSTVSLDDIIGRICCDSIITSVRTEAISFLSIVEKIADVTDIPGYLLIPFLDEYLDYLESNKKVKKEAAVILRSNVPYMDKLIYTLSSETCITRSKDQPKDIMSRKLLRVISLNNFAVSENYLIRVFKNEFDLDDDIGPKLAVDKLKKLQTDGFISKVDLITWNDEDLRKTKRTSVKDKLLYVMAKNLKQKKLCCDELIRKVSQESKTRKGVLDAAINFFLEDFISEERVSIENGYKTKVSVSSSFKQCAYVLCKATSSEGNRKRRYATKDQSAIKKTDCNKMIPKVNRNLIDDENSENESNDDINDLETAFCANSASSSVFGPIECSITRTGDLILAADSTSRSYGLNSQDSYPFETSVSTNTSTFGAPGQTKRYQTYRRFE